MVKQDSREKLIRLIEIKVFSSFDNSIKAKVQYYMTQKDRFSVEEYKKLEKHIIKLDELNNNELLWFAEAIEKTSKELGIQICEADQFFTSEEVRMGKYYKPEKFNVKDLLILNHAFKLAENQFSCVVSIKQLALMKKHGIIKAVPELQRQSNSIKVGDEILKQIKTYSDKINKIKKLIDNNDYDFDELSFNLLNDGSYEYIYDDVNHVIVLPEDGDLLIIDGNNRVLAAEKQYFQNNKSDSASVYFPVKFTYYDYYKTKDVIFQKWQVTPASKTHMDTMKPNYSNFIVDEIRRSPYAEDIYKKSITTTGVDARKQNALIIYAILANAIEKYYNVNEFELKSEALEVSQWLIEYFNYLTKLMYKDFINKGTLKKSKWSVSPYAWIVYTFLSSKLRNDPDWKSKLEVAITSIDWSLENSPLVNKLNYNDERSVELFVERKWSEGNAL